MNFLKSLFGKGEVEYIIVREDLYNDGALIPDEEFKFIPLDENLKALQANIEKLDLLIELQQKLLGEVKESLNK